MFIALTIKLVITIGLKFIYNKLIYNDQYQEV